jgi:hypothetical protein
MAGIGHIPELDRLASRLQVDPIEAAFDREAAAGCDRRASPSRHLRSKADPTVRGDGFLDEHAADGRARGRPATGGQLLLLDGLRRLTGERPVVYEETMNRMLARPDLHEIRDTRPTFRIRPIRRVHVQR